MILDPASFLSWSDSSQCHNWPCLTIPAVLIQLIILHAFATFSVDWPVQLAWWVGQDSHWHLSIFSPSEGNTQWLYHSLRTSWGFPVKVGTFFLLQVMTGSTTTITAVTGITAVLVFMSPLTVFCSTTLTSTHLPLSEEWIHPFEAADASLIFFHVIFLITSNSEDVEELC